MSTMRKWMVRAILVVLVPSNLLFLFWTHAMDPSQRWDEDTNNDPQPVASQQYDVDDSSSSFLADIRARCFPHNSDAWFLLQSREDRYRNHDEGMTDEWIQHVFQGPFSLLSRWTNSSSTSSSMPVLWEHTFCHPTSPVRTFLDDDPSTSTITRTTAEDWYHRFFFLALHWEFHQPALQEYETRQHKNNGCEPEKIQAFQQHYKLGRFDFECPEAKFLICRFASIGFGAVVQIQILTAMMIAVRTHRIPIFLNDHFDNTQQSSASSQAWRMAPQHCSRKDLQCYFLPLSPCTLRLEEIRNATVYGGSKVVVNATEENFLRQHVNLPSYLTHEKVVVIAPGLLKPNIHNKEVSMAFRKHIQSIVGELIDHYQKTTTDPGFDWELLEQAHDWIVSKQEVDESAYRQIFLYVLRLNFKYQTHIQTRLNQLLQTDDDDDESSIMSSVGLPIRGSDKCGSEATCHSVPTYMELPLLRQEQNDSTPTASIGTRGRRRRRPRLIFTTEDPEIVKASMMYHQNTSFPYEFLTNPDDNLQGSGYPRDFAAAGGGDVSEATMISTFLAWRLHLSAGKRVYLNCCSNSHALIHTFLTGQCGARRHGNPAFAETKTTPFPSNATTTNRSIIIIERSPPPLAVCLNDERTLREDNIPNKYRLCCNWGQDEYCKVQFAQYRQEWKEERKRKQELDKLQKAMN